MNDSKDARYHTWHVNWLPGVVEVRLTDTGGADVMVVIDPAEARALAAQLNRAADNSPGHEVVDVRRDPRG